MIEELRKLKEEYDLEDDITELVYHFNRLGLKTLFSCQGHDWFKKPYIKFTCDEENLHNIIKALYVKFSEDNAYIEIGTFQKMCQPMISEDGIVKIENNWLWNGKMWDFNDYKKHILSLTKMFRKL